MMTDNTEQEEIHTTFTPDMLFENIESAMDPHDLLEFLYEKQEAVREKIKANYQDALDDICQEIKSKEEDFTRLEDAEGEIEDLQDRLNASEEWGENQSDRAEEYKGYAEKHMLLMGISADDIDAQYET